MPRSLPSLPTLRIADAVYQTAVSQCQATYDVGQTLTACPASGDLLDIRYDWDRLQPPASLKEFEAAWSNRLDPLDYSGVWRFRRLMPFAPDDQINTIGEGQTYLQKADPVAPYAKMDAGCLFLQYEGLNPSGSFKDNGMTAATTHARMVGASTAACASTGNTSASLAIYAAATGRLRTLVFVGSGKIAYGKLSQALDYGARTLQIAGDFDDALKAVREVCDQAGIYLCNSVNPFRLEGQKAIMYRILEALAWEPPDWIVVPGGNLGNSSAFGKAYAELLELGLVDRAPRLAIINAAGASTLTKLVNNDGLHWNDGHPDPDLIAKFYARMDAANDRADTLASAIEINRPVNLTKCLRALAVMDGVVRDVDDQAILDAKAQVGAGGFGCEPASGATVAGVRLLRDEGIIAPSDRVVCVLTGHQLKDPTATVAYHAATGEDYESKLGSRGVHTPTFRNGPIPVDNDIAAILNAVQS